MARVTVEDCIEHLPNRFELVALAARRAKQISSGSPITLDRDNDKDAVVSLREIAGKTVEFEPLREEIVEGFSRFQQPDVVEGVALPPAPRRAQEVEEEEDEIDALAAALAGELEEGNEPEPDMPEGMSFDDEIEADD